MTVQFSARITAIVLSILTATSALSLPADATTRSRAYCRDYARHHADRRQTKNLLHGALGGALLGAGVGAAVGGHNAVGKGALIGGGVGTVAGAARGSQEWNDRYARAYRACMSGH